MKKLKESEFKDWKEGNQWFWEYLEGFCDELNVALDGIGGQMANTHADLPALQKKAIEIKACIMNMQGIINLSWEDFDDNSRS